MLNHHPATTAHCYRCTVATIVLGVYKLSLSCMHTGKRLFQLAGITSTTFMICRPHAKLRISIVIYIPMTVHTVVVQNSGIHIHAKLCMHFHTSRHTKILILDSTCAQPGWIWGYTDLRAASNSQRLSPGPFTSWYCLMLPRFIVCMPDLPQTTSITPRSQQIPHPVWRLDASTVWAPKVATVNLEIFVVKIFL